MLIPMMLLCVFLSSTWGEDNRVLLYVPPEQILSLQKQAKICGPEYGVDPLAVRKMLDWSLPNDQPHKEFLFCLCNAAGYITNDGHYIVDRMLEIEPINGTRDDLRRRLEDCNTVTKDNYLDTTFEMGTCLHKYHIITTKRPED